MSRRFTEAEIAEVWERRTAGELTRSIARRLGRNGSSIRRLFEDAGGVRPAPRRRAERHLSLREREWRWVVTDPDTRQPVAAGTTRRRPGAAERRTIEARDRTCIFPGCRMPATRCDIDHRTPWAQGGKTQVCDMAALCRHHHIIKHHGWNHRPIRGGDYLWTSRLGYNYTTSGLPP